ncbi:bestrophin-2 isoform X1 [Anopheles arabiensis]|uniref:bestrophin-2 isoform X1 n=1 Tax=Anopheles arabiensis TaxID=7173 RepID=UPI001AAD2296|nr:bestrophin-2 isoform X1 [Anopheles arabiensis]XP_040223553.2 bestrophin-2 isoform X1 [Anopheles coluzzii]XP_040223554.2 bestrophin-2 isoform X1 [Anopheles coluzzii]XP_040223555.2 bestrophin-2 isoform X1 [Anopheles coluzzii]XP_040223557.2 bestrophin-2 isoform X1 [Anopheles coluzzii]XP_061499312.1 bestrophin-2 isoform X1 [Anopheles gambiae]
MTVSYSAEVPNGSNFGVFWRILWKWRGSVYKAVWRELLAYLLVYYTLNFTYRYGLSEDGKRVFERIRTYFGQQRETVPLSFVLGFYVSLVVKRWWEQYRMLPWPDTLALFVSAAIQGNDETGRLMRRNIMRYMVLSYVITLQKISLRVKRRFPGWQHLVDAGLMLESERKIFEIMDSKSPMSKYWMPLVWATNIINRARKDQLIPSDHIVQTLLMELSDIRRRLGGLIGYDTVCVPLVYTQVVTLVLYSYFTAAIMGSQMIPTYDAASGTYQELDVFFPLFTVLQFVFYVGWLKVAEVLINPFGEDDDDIELNWLIDRHIKASYMIVDEMHDEHPELLKDQYWEEVVPKDLPYTVASEHYRREEPKGSAEHYKVKEADAVYANIGAVGGKRMMNDEMYADYESVDTPMAERRKGWLGKVSRMGSGRSSSTAYSSGGLFARNRHNSVYSSPEAGLGQPIVTGAPAPKVSLYDRFVNRKSGRHARQIIKQNSKLSLNGSVISNVPQKARPRIPTPDVTKESRVAPLGTVTTSTANIASGVALMATQLANNPSIYPASTATLNNNEVPVVGTLLLAPIKELDSSSTTNTLHSGQSATASLAKSILPSTLKSSEQTFSRSRPYFAVSPFGKDGTNLELTLTNSSSLGGSPNPLGGNTVIVLPATTTAVAVSANGTTVTGTIPITAGPGRSHDTTDASTGIRSTSLASGVLVPKTDALLPISLTSIPLSFTVTPVTNTSSNSTTSTTTTTGGTIITELPCDNGEISTSVTMSNEKNRQPPSSTADSSSSAASTLSKRKPKHGEVYV